MIENDTASSPNDFPIITTGELGLVARLVNPLHYLLWKFCCCLESTLANIGTLRLDLSDEGTTLYSWGGHLVLAYKNRRV
jgi:hypothetical protein